MKKRTVILLSFIAVKFLLQFFIINPVYELHRDEFLHLDQANHLAWGFHSVPPFTSWTSYLIQLLGNTLFWIKFFPALYGALTIYIVWKAIDALGGSLFALILGATCVLFSALLRLNILYQPNSFDVLSWTLLYYTLLKYVITKDAKWLFIGAVAFAVGFLNKYNLIFLLMGIVPALLLSDQRKIFREPKLYAALALGTIVILPNLLWQYRNDLPVFHHLKELSETQLVNVNRTDFLMAQPLFFIGALPVILAAFYALLFYRPFKPYRFFLLSFIFTLGILTYLKAKEYYAIGIYPVYIAFGAAYIGELLNVARRRYIQPIVILIVIALFVPLAGVILPNRGPEYIIQHAENYRKWGLLRWEDGKDHALPQDFADMLGWKELASKVDSCYSALSKNGNTLVLCDNYGQAGAINYYTRQKIKAVAFEADYINWFDLTRRYNNVIRVKERKDAEKEIRTSSPFFKYAVAAASVQERYAREFGTTVFILQGAKIDIRERLKNEIIKQKNQY